MRTTIIIPDDLWRNVRIKTVQRGLTATSVIIGLLEEWVEDIDSIQKEDGPKIQKADFSEDYSTRPIRAVPKKRTK